MSINLHLCTIIFILYKLKFYGVNMKISRFLLNIKIILYCHLLNPLWKKRSIRRLTKIRRESKLISSYTKKYLTEYNDNSPNLKSLKKECIFTIWFQGEENAPDIVKACFKSIRKFSSYPLIVLDEQNIFDYISLPDFIMKKFKKGKIRYCHFSDICRLELLYRYGGFWWDATLFMTNEIPNIIKNQEFFVYTAYKSSFISNGFIRAKYGNILLKKWRDAVFNYWKEENSIITYFTHQFIFKSLIKNDKEAKILFDKMYKQSQDTNHILWFYHKDDNFNQTDFIKWTAKAFYQKTTYKNWQTPKKGSIADFLLNI